MFVFSISNGFSHIHSHGFSGSKAVDFMLDSKWATGKDPIFSDRESVVVYLNG